MLFGSGNGSNLTAQLLKMVNTRHHQDPGDEPEGTFLSIEERKTMRTKTTPKIVRNLYEMLKRNW